MTVWLAIVSVPVRATPVFAAALMETVPLPLPLVPAVIVNHDALLAAIHAHPLPAVTVTGPAAPALAATDSVVGFTKYEHGAAAWFTVTVRPPMVSVPVRAASLLAATANVTVPLPLPLVPEAIDIHETLLAAVHAHPVAAVTDTDVAVVPAAAMENVDVLTFGKQDAATWDTVTDCPAMVSVPLRAAPVFANALNVTAPSPEPLEPAVIDNHVAVLAAVQEQPVCVSTVIGGPVPPAATTDVVNGVIVYEQGVAAPAA